MREPHRGVQEWLSRRPSELPPFPGQRLPPAAACRRLQPGQLLPPAVASICCVAKRSPRPKKTTLSRCLSGFSRSEACPPTSVVTTVCLLLRPTLYLI